MNFRNLKWKSLKRHFTMRYPRLYYYRRRRSAFRSLRKWQLKGRY